MQDLSDTGFDGYGQRCEHGIEFDVGYDGFRWVKGICETCQMKRESPLLYEKFIELQNKVNSFEGL